MRKFRLFLLAVLNWAEQVDHTIISWPIWATPAALLVYLALIFPLGLVAVLAVITAPFDKE